MPSRTLSIFRSSLVDVGGVKGVGEGFVWDMEALYHLVEQGLSVGLQFGGALRGLALNVAGTIAELHIGLQILRKGGVFSHFAAFASFVRGTVMGGIAFTATFGNADRVVVFTKCLGIHSRLSIYGCGKIRREDWSAAA